MAPWDKPSELSQQRQHFSLAYWRKSIRLQVFLHTLTLFSISASQFIGAPLKFVDPKFYDQYMAWTKESFAVLVSTMTQLWAPTVVRVTGDESMKDQLFQMEDGSLKCNFPHRLVMMANHQLYTDWLYLWWIAYTNKMHGRIYIILKESLKNIPIFGWGAQFYNFIFLARRWETDKPRFRRHLEQLSNPTDPMWLLIFPEGTNLSAGTREKSKAWAEKNGIPDMKHQLLPRSTGLQFCLQELKKSTNWLYDCTIAYEGVPDGQFGQDIFTLRSSFFEGRPPKSVNMYWRRWRIADLPTEDNEAFSMWLRNRWTEKDYLLEHYFRHGTFPEGDPVKAMKSEMAVRKFALEQKKNGNSKAAIKAVTKSAKFITTEVRAGGMEEFMGIFAPIATAATALSSGQLTPENIDFDALVSKVAAQQKTALATKTLPTSNGSSDTGKLSGPPKLSSKTPIGPNSASKVTEGKHLDPEIRRLIESAHANTQRRLELAATPASRKAPNVRNTIPMTPVETIITRPITTLAVQHGANALAKLGPKIEQTRKTVAKSASEAQKSSTAASPTTIKRPVPKRRMSSTPSSASGSTASTAKDGVVKKTAPHPLAGKTIARPPVAKEARPPAEKSITCPPAAPTKAHPLAGKTISRAEFEAMTGKTRGHTPIGQKKVPATK